MNEKEKEFIKKWKEKISSEGIKTFPEDFIRFDDFKELKFPQKTFIMGEEFFGNYEVITTGGDSVFQAEDDDSAKFIIYANRNKPGKVKLPLDKSLIKKANKAHEKYLDELLKEIEKDYSKVFTEGKNSLSIINEIFKSLNLARY